jgi:hypothetical protein
MTALAEARQERQLTKSTERPNRQRAGLHSVGLPR